MTKIMILLSIGFIFNAQTVLGGIQNEIIECHNPTSKRRSEVEAKYRSLMAPTNDYGYQTWFWSYTAQVPDTYLDWIAHDQQLSVKFAPEDEPGSVSGLADTRGLTKITVATLESGTEIFSLKSMWVKRPIKWSEQIPERYFGLIHELGHAADQYLRNLDVQTKTSYNAKLVELFRKNVVGKRESENVSYMVTEKAGMQAGPREYMAEIFESYYCSPKSRALMAKRYPTAYAFAQEFFEAPVDDSEQSASR